MKLLLDKKADVNVRRHTDDATPLHVAAQNGHKDVANLLLDNNADVSASRKDSTTPLYLAAQTGHTDVVKLLLDYKADVNACRLNGVYCFSLWIHRCSETVIEQQC